MLAYAVVRSSFGVFFKPIMEEMAWSSATLSVAYSLSIFVEGGVGIIMGIITDRLGPKMVIILCGFLLGLGFFLASRIETLWQMYLVFGLLIGTGFSGVFVPLVTNLARWFFTRRNVMTGVVLAGTGIGTLLSGPLANWLISAYDWRQSYIIFGIVSFCVFILAGLFLKRDPSRVGQMPDGIPSSENRKPHADSTGFSLNQALSTRQFWLTAFMFFCFGFCGFSITVHIVPHVIESGRSAATGASVLATFGGASILGRLAIGFISSRLGNKMTFTAGYILNAAVILWLAFTGQTWGFFLFTVIFGFCVGGVSSLYAPLVAELFGLKWHGLIFGACGFLAMVGGTIGPILTGYIFDVTGRYQLAFITLSGISIIGMIFSLLIKPLAIEKTE
jgi:MFS family permease